MMIAPEVYYDLYLKDLTKEQLKAKIRSLKKEIASLKKEVQNPESFSICPSPDVRLAVARDYLQTAVKAYIAAGGEYKKTRSDLFQERLIHLRKIILELNSFCSFGRIIRTYDLSGEYVTVTAEKMLDAESEEEFNITSKEMIESLSSLYIGEWKKSYDDPFVMDGLQWELQLEFEGEKKPYIIEGNNAFPYNFERLEDILCISTDEE